MSWLTTEQIVELLEDARSAASWPGRPSAYRKARPLHAPRHTFASHFIQNGGNILTLQKILGYSSLAMTMTMTMRYAHLAPDHLQDAVRFGPLSSL
ncbi:site-specific recombinase XerD [Pseudomonas sp. 3400]|nr:MULTISPECIES: tyrosine-type recombinase/integrase [Pseudomonas]MDP9937888.1 site-specific recombinase XerD [Pseudomonas sp. 3400]MDR7010111.1 site-specific recombinase XerD [Pseudomonas alcaliphila]